MKSSSGYNRIWLNLLIAVAITLIVNFSFVLYKLGSQPIGPPGGGRWPAQQSDLFLWIQAAYYFVLSFILLTISTEKVSGSASASFLKRLFWCTVVTVVFFLIAPRMSRVDGIIRINLYARRILDPSLLLKVSFTYIVAVLYGKIYELIYQKQNIILENEVLKNENLQTTYNTLINQINPHFFFNSLNSLSMLVREGHNPEALTYIDRLSDTFRYIIQNGQTGGTTLSQEIEFVDAYRYLLEVRYEGKLFFDIDIDSKYSHWVLPSLTLQPLIENIVRHNTITRAKPMTIRIYTHGPALVVENSISPRMEESTGTGIGLKNLSQRYILLTGRNIKIKNDSAVFSVTLPLVQPEEELAIGSETTLKES